MALAHTLVTVNLGPTNQEGKDLFHRIVEMNGRVHETIEKNRIYFSENFVSQFDTLFKKINDNFITSSLDKNVLIKDAKQEYIFNDSSLFLNYFNNEFPSLKDKLRKEFKKYL